MSRASKREVLEVRRGRGGLRRREVLKAGGVLGAAAFLEGCRGREREQIEQVLDRSRTPPGAARWARSICAQCSGHCEVVVRLIDGRAKKIEGDASSRVSMGGVCALGHSALQGHYLPARPTRPMHRVDGALVESSWEQALEGIADRLSVRDGSLAFCCGPDPLERAAVEVVAARLGASVTVVESPVAAIERASAERWLGTVADIETPFEGAELLITLGASPLDRWGNPVAFARRLAESRARGMRWVHVGERMSLTAAKADLWIAPRPGAVSAAVELLDELILDASTDDASPEVEANVERIAAALDVPRRRLQRLVRWWQDAATAVLVVGAEDLGVASADSPAERWASEMIGRLQAARRVDAGPKGLGTMRAMGSLSKLRNALESDTEEASASKGVATRSLEELAADCRRGAVTTVLALGVDPVAATPGSWGLQELGPEGLISVAHRMDETARIAGWVLPAQTDLERTQLHCSPATEEVLIADGVVDARGDALHPLDILRALGLAGGVEPATLPWEDAEGLREGVLEAVADLGGGTVARALRGALRADGRLPLGSAESWRTVLPEPSEAKSLLMPGQAELANRGSAPSDVLTLQIFEAPRGEAGAFDRPWIAELPDPVSTVMWGGWIELSPVDAERLGLSQGAAVQVTADADPSRTVASTAYIHPACRPGTAAMPLGVFRSGDQRASTLDLVPPAAVNGVPGLRAAVQVRPATTRPAPIFGRGLRSAEQIPAGWKAQEHASVGGPTTAMETQFIALGTSRHRSPGGERS